MTSTPTPALARGATASYPSGELIHRLIEQQAEVRPNQPAVVCGPVTLTYRELNQHANQLAAQLRGLGAGLEARVGTCLPRSADAVVSALGIVKSDAAPVLLDPAAPEERLLAMLRDCGARILVTSTAAAAISPRVEQVLATEQVRIVFLDRDCAALDAQSGANLASSLSGQNAAHVVYTSGSGGAPKGVVARHATVLQCVHWARQAFLLSAADRFTWVSAPGFGVSLMNELWPALAAGGTVELPDEETLLFPSRLRDWLVGRGITVAQMVRTLAEPLCTMEWPADCALRLLIATGELFTRWPPEDMPFDLVVTYGSTETTHVASWLDAAAGTRLRRTAELPPPVGWPVANVSVYLLDERGDPVPAGAEGEIYVAGPGLARGYLNDPGLTASRWLPDPCAPAPGGRMYRTGDIGRLLPDGNLTILGRADRQVKIRGQRVNLDEVEAALASRDGVVEAAVTAYGSDDALRLAGYVTGLKEDHLPGLFRELRAQLPEHLVPTDVVLLDALPKNANGKVDRLALPEPARSRAASSAPLRAPGTDIERDLAAIWREVLDLAEVGVQDDFFELGGHSMAAVQVVTRIRQRFGVLIELPAFYDHPTVAGIAALVGARVAS